LDDVDSGSHWMTYDAARRGGLLLRGEGAKVLAEPAPDAIASTAISFVAEAASKAQQVDGKVDVEYTRTVAELAGRSQTVLVIREALYRLNELYLNGALGSNATEVGTLYRASLDAVVLLAKAGLVDGSGIKTVAKATADGVAAAERAVAAAEARVAHLQRERKSAADVAAANVADEAARILQAAPGDLRPFVADPDPARLLVWIDEERARAVADEEAAKNELASARRAVEQVTNAINALGTALSPLR
jgi:hypothetical protein